MASPLHRVRQHKPYHPQGLQERERHRQIDPHAQHTHCGGGQCILKGIEGEDQELVDSGESQAKEAGDQQTDEIVRQWVRQTLAAGEGKDVFEACMDHFASLVISEALDLTAGNRSRAAKLLGISRPTLLSKIDKYRLRVETSVKLEGP